MFKKLAIILGVCAIVGSYSTAHAGGKSAWVDGMLSKEFNRVAAPTKTDYGKPQAVISGPKDPNGSSAPGIGTTPSTPPPPKPPSP